MSTSKKGSGSWGEVSPFDKDESLVLNLDAMRQVLGTKGMEAVRDVAAPLEKNANFFLSFSLLSE